MEFVTIGKIICTCRYVMRHVCLLINCSKLNIICSIKLSLSKTLANASLNCVLSASRYCLNSLCFIRVHKTFISKRFVWKKLTPSSWHQPRLALALFDAHKRHSFHGGLEVEHSPRMREIGVRSPVATGLSRKNR